MNKRNIYFNRIYVLLYPALSCWQQLQINTTILSSEVGIIKLYTTPLLYLVGVYYTDLLKHTWADLAEQQFMNKS